MIPNPNAAINRDKKGCHFHTEVEITMNAMDINNNKISHILVLCFIMLELGVGSIFQNNIQSKNNLD